MKVGGLYKLNPKYNHDIGKKLYSLDHNDIIYLKSDEVIMIVGIDRPNYDAVTIKLIHRDQVFIFPYSVYHEDILVEIE